MLLKSEDQLQLAETNVRYLLKKISYLKEVIQKLKANGIRYGMYSGSVVAITTSYRISSDVDLLVRDEDILKLRELFPFANTADIGLGKFLYIGANKEIEFSTMADIKVGKYVYPFRLTDLAWKNTLKLIVDHEEYNILNPVDTILLKAMLQRGKNQGKHDLEDIAQMVAAVDIDKNYLRRRLVEINADERIYMVLKRFKLMLREY